MPLANDRELWRDCVQWFIRCGIFEKNHRVASSLANILEFAQLLRDGVLLCQLANRLHKGSIDLRELNLRPQLSQFLCEHNICLFLRSCQDIFGLRREDLFDSFQLYKVSNFGAVLETLSKLSKCFAAQQLGICGFPEDCQPSSHAGSNYYNEEIYKHLAEEAETKELEEETYNSLNEDDETGVKIYDHIVYKRNEHSEKKEEDFKPKEPRDYCLKELLDTERNYVDALNMMLQELTQIHTAFQSELAHAVRNSFRSSVSSSNASSQRIGDVFKKWKSRFTAYSEYCARLTRAQACIDRLCGDAAIKQKIIECQTLANGNRFRLQDLLSVPMQRILKYHLLLKELVKHTAKDHFDYEGLCGALAAMLDIAMYINETKRDAEHVSTIQVIQSSIVDLTMPENTQLSDYGRLLKDGELKVFSHDDRKPKLRYVFIFDKVLMICKALKNNQYSYKNALVLTNYRVDEAELNNNKFGKANLKAARESTHLLALTTFSSPTNCSKCDELLRGILYQGYKCQKCLVALHKGCISSCHVCLCAKSFASSSAVKSPPYRSHTFHGEFSAGQFVKAVKSFTGNNGGPEFLVFNENDVIELLATATELKGWYKQITSGRDVSTRFATLGSQRRPTSCLDMPPSSISSNPVSGKASNVAGIQEYENSAKLQGFSWYFDSMDRLAAEAHLKGLPCGTYLVRYSPKQNQHVISICHQNEVKHVKIEESAQGFYLDKSRYFGDIIELIQFYENNNLQESFQALDTTLKIPLRLAFMGYALALHDFEATQTKMITLRRGDRIMILSKDGSDIGWWKGKAANGKIGYFPLMYVHETNETALTSPATEQRLSIDSTASTITAEDFQEDLKSFNQTGRNCSISTLPSATVKDDVESNAAVNAALDLTSNSEELSFEHSLDDAVFDTNERSLLTAE